MKISFHLPWWQVLFIATALLVCANSCLAESYLGQMCVNMATYGSKYRLQFATMVVDPQASYFRLDGALLDSTSQVTSAVVTGSAYLTDDGSIRITARSTVSTALDFVDNIWFFDFSKSEDSFYWSDFQQLRQSFLSSDDSSTYELVTGKAVLGPCSQLELLPDPGHTDEDGDDYTLVDGDCNDSDNSVYPGAIEIFGDNIDQDCNAATDQVTVDDDGDGFTEKQGDCNDADPTFYPGAEETSFDRLLGVDKNCDEN